MNAKTENTRALAVASIRGALAEKGMHIWSAERQSRVASQNRSIEIDAYATRKGIVLVVASYTHLPPDPIRCDSVDVYVPVEASNSLPATLEAIERFLGGAA